MNRLRTSPRAVLAAAVRTLRRPPRAAYWCALIGTLNALAWSVLTPPFQSPDENGHYAYVQQLVEHGSLPTQPANYNGLSPAEDATLAALHSFEVQGQPHNPSLLVGLEERQLASTEREHLSAAGTGNALNTAANPPLYYALEAVPFILSPSGTVLDRLELMRVLSAIFAGFTVFFAFMFLRELFPGTRWAWSFGAIAVALQPLFAFISGSVNNDALLYAFAAALFFAVARMFRRGLNDRTGLAIGGIVGFGLLAKFTLLGFTPAVAIAILCGIRRAGRSGRRAALRGAASAAALGVLPTLLYVELLHRVVASGGLSAPATPVAGVPTGLKAEISHIWELFLPRLPTMRTDFPLHSELWHEWFIGLIGRFGLLDTSFPFWVYLVAAPIAILLVLAALGDMVRERRRLWRHADELVVYVAMVVGLCVEIGVESYRSLAVGAGVFEQPRYLLPGLCIYAAIVALATRLPPRRWGIAIGGAIVMLALIHDVFSQLLMLGRFYA
jgi:4-amino-4-deoxy-L-arabinose transferase-like glycosyltransferase